MPCILQARRVGAHSLFVVLRACIRRGVLQRRTLSCRRDIQNPAHCRLDCWQQKHVELHGQSQYDKAGGSLQRRTDWFANYDVLLQPGLVLEVACSILNFGMGGEVSFS